MGLHHCKELEGGNLLLTWKIDESLPALFELACLDTSEQIRYSKITSAKKQSQWLSVRALINTYYNEKIALSYLEDGRPMLHNQTNISISHSGDFVAILLNEKRKTGVDIQKIAKNNIIKGKSYFINNIELESLPELSNRSALHLFWSVKEACYKWAANPHLNLKEDITILPFMLGQSGTLRSWLSSDHHPIEALELYYEIWEDYTLACTI